MKNYFRPERLNYEDIRKRANEFLQDYNPHGSIPVDIEDIAEFKLGLEIVPQEGLEYRFNIDSFLTKDLKQIYIDRRIYDFEQRCRYSVAHEIGHLVLHKKLYESINFNSVEEWKEIYDNFDSEDYRWFEFQAYSFAGLILVPKGYLIKRMEDCRNIYQGYNINDVNLLEDDVILDYVSQWISRRFNVTREVVRRRIINDKLSF